MKNAGGGAAAGQIVGELAVLAFITIEHLTHFGFSPTLARQPTFVTIFVSKSMKKKFQKKFEYWKMGDVPNGIARERSTEIERRNERKLIISCMKYLQFQMKGR